MSSFNNSVSPSPAPGHHLLCSVCLMTSLKSIQVVAGGRTSLLFKAERDPTEGSHCLSSHGLTDTGITNSAAGTPEHQGLRPCLQTLRCTPSSETTEPHSDSVLSFLRTCLTASQDHLTCLLRNLYASQEATVRTGHGTTDWFQMGKGVRQGCILSPCLFNSYAEYIMRNAGLDEAQAGIKIAGRNINNLRYADDTTLMAESKEELKSLLMKVKKGVKKLA